MPMGPGFYGTTNDGSETQQYCTFCYQHGAFTDPSMTMEKMITLSIDNMVNDQKMPRDRAEPLAREFIPELGRWKKIKE